MTRQAPPTRFSGAPATMPLPAGTALSRLHQARFASDAFNPIGSDTLFGGGRFDATPLCRYGFLYAALHDGAAVAEGLLRDIPADDHGGRFLPRRYWSGRRLSRLRTTEQVELVALRTGTELGAIGQDTWLTTCDADDYPQTRAWAHWLRDLAPAAAGIAWLSKRDPGETVMALFEDRCPPGLLADEPGPLAPGVAFDDHAGFAWLRTTLAPYRVAVRRPALPG